MQRHSLVRPLRDPSEIVHSASIVHSAPIAHLAPLHTAPSFFSSTALFPSALPGSFVQFRPACSLVTLLLTRSAHLTQGAIIAQLRRVLGPWHIELSSMSVVRRRRDTSQRGVDMDIVVDRGGRATLRVPSGGRSFGIGRLIRARVQELPSRRDRRAVSIGQICSSARRDFEPRVMTRGGLTNSGIPVHPASHHPRP